ncbi:MAG: hypothetical protein HY783_11240 [Chloroflexi bacterium]|nr:hypothetical protein [Chloroflexota bacterium]
MELTLLFLLGFAIVIFFLFRGQRSGGVNRCTRCDGTGQVNERWPDPKEPGGWHILEGTCPKCKGKGRV